MFIQKEYISCIFQTSSASDLPPRTTLSHYARSAGSLLLLLPPPGHSPSSWDISGGRGRGETEEPGEAPNVPSCCGSWPRPKGEQRAAQSWAGLAAGGTEQHPKAEQAQGYLHSGKEGAAIPKATDALRPQEKWKKKAKYLERPRYSKLYNPNSPIYGREKQEGEAETGRKKSTSVKLHRKRQILSLKVVLPWIKERCRYHTPHRIAPVWLVKLGFEEFYRKKLFPRFLLKTE